MEKIYDPTLLPPPRKDAAYTPGELDMIGMIPARDQRTWVPYATACVEDPDDFFLPGAEQNEVAKRCLIDCPVVRICGEFAVRKAGPDANTSAVHGGMTSQRINTMRKRHPQIRWKD